MATGLNVNTAGAATNRAAAAARDPATDPAELRGKLATENGVEQVHLTAAEPIPRPADDTYHHKTGAQLSDYSPKLAEGSDTEAFNDFFKQPSMPADITEADNPAYAAAHADVDRFMRAPQHDPSGSRSRVAGASKNPLTSRLDKNTAELFKKHGLPAPRKDIKIPFLNITIFKRDTELKALLPRLDTAQAELTAYHEALETDLAAQTPRQRAETVVQLNEKLDALERTLLAAETDLAKANSNLRGRLAGAEAMGALMGKLHAEIDNERALIVDAGNNFSLDKAAPDTPLKWQHALEFKRVGLNIGNNVNVGAGNSKTVVSAKPFGSGACNTVHQLQFDNGSVGIFKSSTVDENPGDRVAVAHAAEIPKEQPRYGARNVASSRLDKLLGANILTDTEFFVHDGQLGVLMEKAEGKALQDLRWAGPLRHKSPRLYKDLTDLQVLDAITGQHDRHFGNVVARVDRAGNYLGLKGIDNDNAFGANPDYNDLHKFQDIPRMATRIAMIGNRDYHGASYNVGLPPVIDAGLADKILADDFISNAEASVTGLLSAEETEMMVDRLNQVREHVQKLKDTNRTVSRWDSGLADNDQLIGNLFANDARHSYVQAMVRSTR